ncbi:hypothetical protein [Burkholderia pseudomallei]|uniref:hypothetical protein n=1 Tax=Burkholderia pseudomallei TaxID=28450 RepID=UPI00236097F3|nr:hypothetical protein [Burkholderia pseudomallei]
MNLILMRPGARLAYCEIERNKRAIRLNPRSAGPSARGLSLHRTVTVSGCAARVQRRHRASAEPPLDPVADAAKNARSVTCSKVTNMSEKGKKASEFINRPKIRTTRIEPSAAAAAKRRNAVNRAFGPAPEPPKIQ